MALSVIGNGTQQMTSGNCSTGPVSRHFTTVGCEPSNSRDGGRVLSRRLISNYCSFTRQDVQSGGLWEEEDGRSPCDRTAAPLACLARCPVLMVSESALPAPSSCGAMAWDEYIWRGEVE